jgi:HD-GYP domain-containing protein (c-di-GMP phosphodiesterase class II)
LNGFLKSPPYNIIFSEPKKEEVLSLIADIQIIEPILDILNYFKENDYYTYRHVLIVFALSTLMSLHFIKDKKKLFAEITAGSLHDVGKICVPLNILKKSEPLSKVEKRILEHHAIAGYIIVSYLLKDSRSFSARVCLEHHERNDGSGYPMGIHLINQRIEIIAACDIYDALLSERPYRPVSYDNRTAIEEITGMAVQGKLSWDVVKVLVAYNRKDKTEIDELKVSREKRGVPPQKNVYGISADDEDS